MSFLFSKEGKDLTKSQQLVSELMGYGVSLAMIEKTLGQAAVKAGLGPILQSGKPLAKNLGLALKNAFSFGLEDARRMHAQGGSSEEIMESFGKGMWLGAPFGAVESRLKGRPKKPSKIEIEVQKPKAFEPAKAVEEIRRRAEVPKLEAARPAFYGLEGKGDIVPAKQLKFTQEGMEFVKPEGAPTVPLTGRPYELGTKGLKAKVPTVKEPVGSIASGLERAKKAKTPKETDVAALALMGTGAGVASEESSTADDVLAASMGLLAMGLAKSKAGSRLKTYLGDVPAWKSILKGERILKVGKRGFDPANGFPGKTEMFLRKKVLGPEYTFPVAQSEAKMAMRDKIQGFRSLAEEVLKDGERLKPEQGEWLNEITMGRMNPTDPAFVKRAQELGLPQRSVNLAQKVRSTVNDLGYEMVQRGLLSEEKYKSQLGTYLRKVYKEHIRKTLRAAPRTVKKVYARKELSEAWRAQNEILNYGPKEAATLIENSNRVAFAKYFDKITKDPYVTLPDNIAAKLEKTGKYEGTYEGRVYKRMGGKPPEEFPPGIRRWRAEMFGKRGMQGKWVLEPVADDLNDMFEFTRWYMDSISRTYLTARQAWKSGKAAVNVPNSIANLGWNFVAADQVMQKYSIWSPKGFRHVRKAFDDIRNRNPEYLEAVKENTFGQHIAREEFDRIATELGKERLDNLTGMLTKVQEITDKASAHYDFSERLGKMAIVNYARNELGMNMRDASRLARKHLYDYGDIPKAVRFVRNVPAVGAPFITFWSKSIPRMFEYSLNMSNPLKWWKYPLAVVMAGEAMREIYNYTDEELDEARQGAPDWMPKTVVPGVRVKGKPSFMMPVIPFMEVFGSQKELPILGMFNGGPEMAPIELMLNRNRYWDSAIFGPKERTWQAKTKKGAEHLLRAWGPQAIMQGMALHEAATGKKGPSGDVKRELLPTALSLGGIRTFVPKERTVKIKKAVAKKEYKKSIRALKMDKSMSSGERQRELRQAEKEYNEVMNQLR
jgi:hypothetical protein